jgi:hypothetical protein
MDAGDSDVDVIATVARALIAGNARGAHAALAPIAGQTIVTHPIVEFPRFAGHGWAFGRDF